MGTRRVTDHRVYGVVGLICAMSVGLCGCDVDSFADPSNVGRWENTPVSLPILDRLDVIDEPRDEILGLSEIIAEDLIPEDSVYTIGPGDLLTVTVQGLYQADRMYESELRVDEEGNIDVPFIRKVYVKGKTALEAVDVIADKLQPDYLNEPIVTVFVAERQQRTFTIIGTKNPGPYIISRPNFKVMDAIALGGGLPPNTEKIYIFRQVTVEPETGEQPTSESETAPEGGSAKDPVETIEELATPPEEKSPHASAPPPSTLTAALERENRADPNSGRYIHVDGEWVLVEGVNTPSNLKVNPQYPARRHELIVETSKTLPVRQASAAQVEAQAPDPEPLQTQRVILIDTVALYRGETQKNIIIRPNDTVMVPEVKAGYVFLNGAVARIGTYNLENEKITLTSMIIAAGGLDPVAIPERCDIYRRMGKNQQAILRVNLRSIFEGNTPNIFLKPYDEINIGTNLFASHLAVIRNSFRMTYGFGFLLDRNFGNDVFGIPPGFRSGF